ncbi:hypothetical protein AAAV23_05335 [Sutterella wadsworthensis]
MTGTAQALPATAAPAAEKLAFKKFLRFVITDSPLEVGMNMFMQLHNVKQRS